MSDPVLFCGIVLARFLQFMDFHGNVANYAMDFDASMFVTAPVRVREVRDQGASIMPAGAPGKPVSSTVRSRPRRRDRSDLP